MIRKLDSRQAASNSEDSTIGRVYWRFGERWF
jgi:hypothetical protein